MSASDDVQDLHNGPGAAAILAAALGCFALGAFALWGDASKAANAFFTFYKPTGGLSGVTDCAIAVWLVAWLGLDRLWKSRSVNLGRVSLIAFLLLLGGFLLTFPPFMDLVQGK